jgi:hypothetical protein
LRVHQLLQQKPIIAIPDAAQGAPALVDLIGRAVDAVGSLALA